MPIALISYGTSRYSTLRIIMKSHPKIPSLGYALLGLLHGNPSSGYDLRKVFSSTSMKVYSDSPGAIYPALRRLERQGLISSTIEEGAGLRRRQLFRLTPKGLAELKIWITRPVIREELIWGEQGILLRFAFAHTAAGAVAALELLKSLEAELETYIPSLHEELRAGKSAMPLSARLAFQWGIRGNESLLEWTRSAISTYKKELKGATP
jgi:DNA-binding PadR family transcriptional regulator